MAIQLGSWADFGYRKVGPLPSSGGGLSAEQLVERLTPLGDYEATPERWVRRSARRRGVQFPEFITIATVLDRDTVLDDDCLAFPDEHSRSEWVRLEWEDVRLRADQDVLVEVVEAASSEDRWRGMYRLAQALFYAGAERLRPMLRQYVAPCFFRLYPEGKIVVLRYGTDLDTAAAIQRTLYTLAQAPLPELTKCGFPGFQTLSNWHLASLTHLLPLLLDLFCHLFYPFVGGASGCLPGLAFAFLFEPPERHVPP